VLILFVVALMHLLLYLLLKSSMHVAPTRMATPRTVTLTLTPAPQVASPPTPPMDGKAPIRWGAARAPRIPEPITAPAVSSDARPVAESAASHDLPQAISRPAGPTDAAPSSEVPASQPPPSLNLRLRPGFATQPGAGQPALDDPRANPHRLTAAERMAATLGTDDRVTEENLGGGRRRIRRGNKCVIVSQSRIGELMPFNDAAVRTPSLAGACP